MAQISCGGGVSVSGSCLSDSSTGNITGTGLDTRVAVWSSETNITYRNVVIDSSSNLDLNTASAGHIIPRSEAYTVTAGGNHNPEAGVDVSFVTLDNSTCTGTLADGTIVGQRHSIVMSSFAGGSSVYDLTVTSFQPSSGVAGTYILRFTASGQSAMLIWDGSNWLVENAGALVV